MGERLVVGLNPWLPPPLSRWKWWTEPVRAERLAALRIGVGIVLLFDVLVHYLPQVGDFFGAGSLGSPEIFAQEGNVSSACNKLAVTRSEHPNLGSPAMKAQWGELEQRICVNHTEAQR